MYYYFLFRNNNIQNKGFKLLCDSIVNHNSPLTILIVWNNNLDAECAESLTNLMVFFKDFVNYNIYSTLNHT